MELRSSVCNISIPGAAESEGGGAEGRGYEFPGRLSGAAAVAQGTQHIPVGPDAGMPLHFSGFFLRR